MKKYAFVLVAIIATLNFSSCNDDFESELANDPILDSESQTNHQISKEDALSALNDFLAESTNGNLKSLKVDIDTAEMWGIKYNSLVNNNKSMQINSGNLVYVANFADEQGYAILAADDRINEEVLIISDNGSLSKDVASQAAAQLQEDRVIFDEYPLTGDGFFTVPQYPDEVFMNPNTVSLYDEKEEDTLVGFYSTDNIGEENENGMLISSGNKSMKIMDDEPLLAVGLGLSYAQKQVETQQFQDNNSTRTIKTTSNWEDSGVKSQTLLNSYKYWGQQSPFNDLYPKRRKYILFGHRRKVPAGCFPLAIAKIMVELSYPSLYTFNGYKVNWSSLKGEKGYNTTEGKKSAATLLYGISEGCRSLYFYQGTFTFPHNAISFMKMMGFKNVDKYNYTFSRVKNMIDKGNPVIIYAMPNFKITDSHAWNIDGYKTKTRIVTTKTYIGNKLTKTETITETREMVHCDFGWGGKCNGYYVSGIFNLNSSENDIDKKELGSKNVKYNKSIKIITYNK